MTSYLPAKDPELRFSTSMTYDDLCARCLHRQDVRAGQSTFLLCRRSREDRRFAKYPRRPCLFCPGFEVAPTGPREEREPNS